MNPTPRSIANSIIQLILWFVLPVIPGALLAAYMIWRHYPRTPKLSILAIVLLAAAIASWQQVRQRNWWSSLGIWIAAAMLWGSIGIVWNFEPVRLFVYRRLFPVREISAGSTNAVEPQPVTLSPTDWPGWRGPHGDGTIDYQARFPAEWGDNKNIVWKSPVPGRGHSSPIVVGGRVFLTTADEQRQTQSVVCYDLNTGAKKWERDIHTGGFATHLQTNATHADSTPASDGHLVFAVFLHENAIWATAVDLDGNQIWQKRVGDFDLSFGFGASPIIYQSWLIVAADHQAGGYLAALNRATGDIQWLKKRPMVATYSTPSLIHAADKDQLVLSGAATVTSYLPATGEQLWKCDGTADATVGSVVSDGKTVFASGGSPQSQTLAIRADGSNEIVWQATQKTYVPSLLYHDGFVYAINDDGVAFCWDAATGKAAWRRRVSGHFSASPLFAGNYILTTNEEGQTIVFEANPQRFTRVAENQLGNEAFASPVVTGNRLLLRVGHLNSGAREEYLYCVGTSAVGNESSPNSKK